jgi:phage tail-like protein
MNNNQVSSYLDYLPAMFRQETFLGRFLLAFEQVLTGLGNVDKPGLEEVLGGIVDPESGEEKLPGIHHYFDPGKTPVEFLEWLSDWVALSLRADLNDDQRRDFIAKAVPLYRLRGTKPGLVEMIRIYTALPPVIL